MKTPKEADVDKVRVLRLKIFSLVGMGGCAIVVHMLGDKI